MSKKLNVKVNGNAYEVTVGDLNASPVNVSVNGKEYQVEFVEAASESATLTTQVFDAAPVTKATKAPAGAASSNADVIAAPMPGTILDISVKPGDDVAVGTIICALEAMKMKNMIRSPRAGKVASVEVTAGQKVGFGAVIIRFA
jgi:glutaconyl-CoA/methylmalonyl-CoA decarboxylase subunit gamma